MKIIKAYPPNIKEIERVFGPAIKGNIYAYGDVLYNPDDVEITEPFRIHELTHIAQQNGQPQRWWKKYMYSKEFMIEQEVEAYSNQFNCYRTHRKDGNSRVKYLHRLALTLASPVYGNAITFSEALKKIKTHADSGYSQGR